MGTILNRYRASEDPERFNSSQTMDEQMVVLRELSYGVDANGEEFGELVELRLAIIINGEQIPGRSLQQSLAMTEEALRTSAVTTGDRDSRSRFALRRKRGTRK